MMTFAEFHNGLRVLLNIDLHELRKENLFLGQQPGFAKWERFRDNPHMEFIRMPTAEAKAVWSIMEELRVEHAASREERAHAALAAVLKRRKETKP